MPTFNYFWKYFLSVGLFCLLIAGQINANTIEIAAVKSEFTTVPGKVLSTLIKIKNTTSQPQRLKPFVNLPSGWRLFSERHLLQLAPNETQSVLLSFQVGANELAGNFQIAFGLQSLNEKQLEQKCQLQITVETIHKIVLEPVSAPKYVQAGRSFYAKFVISNFGNTTQKINLTPYYCEIEGLRTFDLAPQKSEIIEVLAPTAKEVYAISKKSIRLEASVENETVLPRNAYQHVTILPNISKENTPDWELPGYINLSWLSRKNAGNPLEQRLQGTFFLKGHLDAHKKKAFAVKARGPNRFSHSNLGLYDEYYASIELPNISAFVGDKTYQLSTLTEFSRYARGIEFSQRADKLSYGTFYYRPRFFADTKEGYAFWTKYQMKNNTHIGLNFLKKNDAYANQSAYLYSLETTLKPFKRAVLDMEYALGTEGEKSGNALFLSLNANPLARLNFFGRLVYASKDYPGYFSDARIYSGSANYQLSKKISLSSSFSQDEGNIARDTLFGIAPLSKQLQASVKFNLNEQSRINLQGRFRTSKDRQTNVQFHYEEKMLRLSYFQTLQQVNFSLNGEYGHSLNLLNEIGEQDAFVYRSFADITWSISAKHSIRGFCQFFDQNTYSQFKEKALIYGLSAKLKVTKSSQLFFQYQSNYQLEEYYRDRNLLEFSFTQNIGKQHSLNLTAKYALLQNTVSRKDWISAIRYNWNFGIPIKQPAQTAPIYGRIISSGIDDLGGILLQLNGQTVVTDERGHFEFKTMPPGEYYLLVDKSTLGIHRIPDVPLPIKVTVKANEPTKIVFGLIKGVKVYGKLNLESIEKRFISFKKNKTAFNPILIEIANNKETYRQLTDEFATFSFADLCPGKWTLRVLKNESHQHFHFPKESFTIHLLPGGEQAIEIAVEVKKRDIQFQPSTTLSLNLNDD